MKTRRFQVFVFKTTRLGQDQNCPRYENTHTVKMKIKKNTFHYWLRATSILKTKVTQLNVTLSSGLLPPSERNSTAFDAQLCTVNAF